MTSAPTSFLASETLPIEPFDRDVAVRIINTGRRFLSPIPLTDGAFYFPQGGTYQLFVGPSGERVGIWAQNPDDLELETLEVNEALSAELKMTVGEGAEAQQQPVPVGTKLQGRLRDKGNGNIERLRIFAMKPEAMEKKWLREEIARHQHAFQSFTETYGTLFRSSETLWVSDGIIYEAVSAKDDETGTRFDLMMTSAPAHGWALGRNYNEVFSGLAGKFLRAASVRAKDLTMEEIEKLVPADFEKRACLFVEGTDPYAVVLNGKSNGKVPLKYKARKIATRVAYALAQLRAMRMLGRLGVVTAVNGFIAAVAYVALGSPITPLWMLRIAGQTASGTGKEMFEYLKTRKIQMDDPAIDSLMQLYGRDFNHFQIWGGRLKPEMAKYLTALNHDQLNTDLNPGEKLLDGIPADEAALEYIAGATEGPVGSHGAFFKLGGYTGLRIYEPNGLNVEYIPERGVSYATMDWSKYDKSKMPTHVAAFMERKRDAGATHVRVSYDKTSRRIVCLPMTKDEYFADFDSIRTAPYISPYQTVQTLRLVAPERPVSNRSLFQRIVRDGWESATEGGKVVAEQVWKIFRGPTQP